MASMQTRRATAWTGTVKLLDPGSATGLEAVSRLRIGELIRVCDRIVADPYREACRRGLT
jgi:hypothetical protein